MICDNCIHQKACINAYASMGYFVDETKENEYKHTILKCKEFEDKEKYQAAIEKQIPKKPINRYEKHLPYMEEKMIFGRCPICSTRQSGGSLWWHKHYNKFCYECGQALDWSDEQ